MKLSKKFFANLISLVFNPFLFIYLTIFFNFNKVFTFDSTYKYIFFVVTVAILMLVYLLNTLQIKDHALILHSLNRKDRDNYYLICIFLMSFIVLFTNSFTLNQFKSILLFFVFYCGMMFLVNHNIDKVSMHVSAFVIFIVTFIHRVSYIGFTFFLFLPLLFWARIYLRKHTLFQLYLGLFVGLLTGIFILLL